MVDLASGILNLSSNLNAFIWFGNNSCGLKFFEHWVLVNLVNL